MRGIRVAFLGGLVLSTVVFNIAVFSTVALTTVAWADVETTGASAFDAAQCSANCSEWALRYCGEPPAYDTCGEATVLLGTAVLSEELSAAGGVLVRSEGIWPDGTAWVLVLDLPGPTSGNRQYELNSAGGLSWQYYEARDSGVVFDGALAVGLVSAIFSGAGRLTLEVDACVQSAGPDGVLGTGDDAIRDLSCGAVESNVSGSVSPDYRPTLSQSGAGILTAFDLLDWLVGSAYSDPGVSGYEDLDPTIPDPWFDDPDLNQDGYYAATDSEDGGCGSYPSWDDEEDDSGGCADSGSDDESFDSGGCSGDTFDTDSDDADDDDDDDDDAGCFGDAYAADLHAAPTSRSGRRDRQTRGRLGVWGGLFVALAFVRRMRRRAASEAAAEV